MFTLDLKTSICLRVLAIFARTVLVIFPWFSRESVTEPIVIFSQGTFRQVEETPFIPKGFLGRRSARRQDLSTGPGPTLPRRPRARSTRFHRHVGYGSKFRHQDMDRRFSCMFPFSRVRFWVLSFDPHPFWVRRVWFRLPFLCSKRNRRESRTPYSVRLLGGPHFCGC